MEWKQVKDETPPVGKHVLLGQIHGNSFFWKKVMVEHPYSRDKKFNPNYYCFSEMGGEEEIKLNHYWMIPECP